MLPHVQQTCDPDLPVPPPCNQNSTTMDPIQPSPTDAVVIDPSHGFNVVVDNWVLEQEVWHVTSDHQNTNIHWVNHNRVENRVSGNHLHDDKIENKTENRVLH